MASITVDLGQNYGTMYGQLVNDLQNGVNPDDLPWDQIQAVATHAGYGGLFNKDELISQSSTYSASAEIVDDGSVDDGSVVVDGGDPPAPIAVDRNSTPEGVSSTYGQIIEQLVIRASSGKAFEDSTFDLLPPEFQTEVMDSIGDISSTQRSYLLSQYKIDGSGPNSANFLFESLRPEVQADILAEINDLGSEEGAYDPAEHGGLSELQLQGAGTSLASDVNQTAETLAEAFARTPGLEEAFLQAGGVIPNAVEDDGTEGEGEEKEEGEGEGEGEETPPEGNAADFIRAIIADPTNGNITVNGLGFNDLSIEEQRIITAYTNEIAPLVEGGAIERGRLTVEDILRVAFGQTTLGDVIQDGTEAPEGDDKTGDGTGDDGEDEAGDDGGDDGGTVICTELHRYD